VNENNPTPNLGPIEATNPCGEQPLLFYESCNLGSINVAKFANTEKKDLEWNRLEETIKLAVRFLDDVIDVNHYPIPEIKKMTLGNRKIGLGIMGYADTLILLGIKYDSEEAEKFAEKLASFIQKHAHNASEELANERGCFPNWKGSVWDTKYCTWAVHSTIYECDRLPRYLPTTKFLSDGKAHGLSCRSLRDIF
jgi:ribonucleoside-diphosphate reductase alpha chain